MTKRRSEQSTVNADLLPVMNVMFLLIPALLMAMEFASMSQIPVFTSRVSDLPTSEPPRPTTPKLEFKVMIASDGFETRSEGAEKTRIPRAGDGYNFAALTAAARSLKQANPDESSVTITAEGDVPMDILIRTMDALRGDTCKLGALAKGEAPADACLFWSPVIASYG